jgi:hypothetical protein
MRIRGVLVTDAFRPTPESQGSWLLHWLEPKAKLAEVVPYAGAFVGGGFNVYFTNTTPRTSSTGSDSWPPSTGRTTAARDREARRHQPARYRRDAALGSRRGAPETAPRGARAGGAERGNRHGP